MITKQNQQQSRLLLSLGIILCKMLLTFTSICSILVPCSVKSVSMVLTQFTSSQAQTAHVNPTQFSWFGLDLQPDLLGQKRFNRIQAEPAQPSQALSFRAKPAQPVATNCRLLLLPVAKLQPPLWRLSSIFQRSSGDFSAISGDFSAAFLGKV